jgi:hypothetical protein
MRRTLVFLALLGLCLAEDELYKNAKIKPVVSTPSKTSASIKSSILDAKASEKQSKQTPAQKRQDTYGAPAAPSVDTYGSPQSPPVDTYGSPSADPVAPVAPVQGEVGTQGYYYYYYPVANSYPSSTSQNSKVSSSSSSGGLLGGGGLGLILGLGLLVAVLAVLAISFSGNSGRRSLTESLLNVDIDDLAYNVYNAIELWNNLSA